MSKVTSRSSFPIPSHPFSSVSIWLRRNLALILTFLAFFAAIMTYAAMTGSSAPLGIKPQRVMFFFLFDIGLLALLGIIIITRIYHLWTSRRLGRVAVAKTHSGDV